MDQFQLRKKYLNFLAFPGILIIGIIILIFSLSRVNHWDNQMIIAMGAIGLVFLLFGLDLKYTLKPIFGLICAIITIISILIYFFISHAGTDLLAIIGTLGLAGIVAETLYSRFDAGNLFGKEKNGLQNQIRNQLSTLNNSNFEFKEIDTQFESLKEVIQGFKIKNLEKIEKVNEVNHEYLLTILKTRDYLDKIISRGDPPQAIKNLDLEIDEFLEDRNIVEMNVIIGDLFNPLTMTPTIEPKNSQVKVKSIIKKGYMIKNNQSEKIIRKSVVEIIEI